MAAQPSQAAQLTAEQQIAELVDEIVFQQNQCDQLASCSEALLEYIVALEQKVLVPAFGSLVGALVEFQDVADARARGQTLASAAVNAGTHPQLARLFNSMAQPLASTVADAKRQQLLSGPPLNNLDNIYVAATSLLQQHQDLIRLTSQARSHGPGDVQHNDVIQQQRGTIEQLQRRVSELEAAAASPYAVGTEGGDQHLKKQLFLSEQRNTQAVSLAKQENELLVAKLNAAEAQLHDSNRELDDLRGKYRAAQTSDGLYQQASNERRLLSERVKALEEQVRQNDADRAAVAESFEVLQRALEASGNPIAIQQAASIQMSRTTSLEQEVKSLREMNDTLKSELNGINQRHDKVVADLRKKLIYAQQNAQRNLGGASASLLSLLDPPSGQATGGSLGASALDLSKSSVSEMPKAKLKAFEMTVAALNAELAQLEEKIVSMEAKYADERELMQQKMDAERQRFETEQAECDNVLASLSAELEQLMKENADLRMRFQMQYAAPMARRA